MTMLPGDHEALALRSRAGLSGDPSLPSEYLEGIPGLYVEFRRGLFEEVGTYGLVARPSGRASGHLADFILDAGVAFMGDSYEGLLGLLLAGWYCSPDEPVWMIPPSSEAMERRVLEDPPFLRILEIQQALFITGPNLRRILEALEGEDLGSPVSAVVRDTGLPHGVVAARMRALWCRDGQGAPD
jgi:hypothetical protein